MAHWTEAQTWKNTKTAEIVTAAELLKRNDRYFRVTRTPSLCCATFAVRDESGQTWERVK